MQRNLNAVIMKDLNIVKNFNEFRKWFNRNFSLSFDGKFKGLSYLVSIVNPELFAYRLYKKLSGRFRCPLGDIISMRISGHSIKLYSR